MEKTINAFKLETRLMITQKLKVIFSLSVPVFIAHGLEEYLTGFYDVDTLFKSVFRSFETMSNRQATFLLFQIMIWLLYIVTAFLIANEQWRLRLMVIPGLIYIFELHHIVMAINAFGYYPGVITALLFPVIGFFYLREYIRIFTTKNL